MRLQIGISKNRHGTYYAIKKVPARLQGAVARVLNNDKARQAWLKRAGRRRCGSIAPKRLPMIQRLLTSWWRREPEHRLALVW